MLVEGEFLDTVIGIQDSPTQIVMLRLPDGGTGIELSSFVRPDHEPGAPAAMANELGLRNVCFEVADLQASVDCLASDGHGLVGGTRTSGAWPRSAAPKGSLSRWSNGSADARVIAAPRSSFLRDRNILGPQRSTAGVSYRRFPLFPADVSHPRGGRCLNADVTTTLQEES
jgi:hypothetical protein